MSKITLTGHILVPHEDLASVKRALPDHVENTLAEYGCISFEVSPDSDNPHRFNVYEEFKDKESFETHQRRVAKSHWGLVSARVTRHYEITEG